MWRVLRAARCLLFVATLTSVAGAQVSGTVRDSATNQPLAGVRVSLQASLTETVSGPAGAYSFPTLTGTNLVIVGAMKGYWHGVATVSTPATNADIAMDPVVADDPSYTPEPPVFCSMCHDALYSQWLDSPMAHAGTNTWVYDLYDGSGTPGGKGGFVYTRDSVLATGNPASECAACHQPERWFNTPYTALDPLAAMGPAVQHGVSCDICHKIADIDPSKPNFPGLYPGVVKLSRPGGSPLKQVQYGVLGDVSFEQPGGMRPSYQPQLRAEVCAACHQDKNDPDLDGDFEESNGVISEPTYLEWRASPYGNPFDAKYRSCADCHMLPTGMGQACSIQWPPLTRPPGDVRSHRFPGTTAEYLEHAVTLGSKLEQKGSSLELDVSIVNDKTGHHVPTGVTIRNMILLVEAWRAEDGLSLTYTGTQLIDDLGGVGDPKQGYFAGLPGKLYAKVIADAKGNAPTFFTDAASILWDNRIPALGEDDTHYSFAIPKGGGELHVRARLVYRRSFRAVTDEKGWQSDGHGKFLEDLKAPYFGHLMAESEHVLDQGPMTCDGGPCDAGHADAGGDAGPDAGGAAGAAGSPNAGGSAATRSTDSGRGCGCRTTPERGGHVVFWSLLGVGLATRRRRSGRLDRRRGLVPATVSRQKPRT